MPAELTLMIILVYAVTGIFAGLIGGMLGLGGGIIIVPILHHVFALQNFPGSSLMHVAVTTSLATIIITSLSATYAHHRKGAVLWSVVKRFAPGIIIGAGIGAILAGALSSNVMRIVFGVFEILVAIQIAYEFKPESHAALPGTLGLVGSGAGIGLFSTLLGIGGGTLTVPFLLWCNINIRNAIAISSACGLPIAMGGTVAMVTVGWNNSDVPAYSLGYLYWPAAIIIMMTTIFFAPLGARLAHYLPVRVLKRIFAVLLAIVGMRMLIQA